MKSAAETNSLPLGLVLELRHRPELAEARHRRQQPCGLGVRRDVALAEDRRPLRVEPGREEHRGEVERRVAQLLRVVVDADRVQVDDAEERVVRLLRLGVLAEAAAVVAERLPAGRLDAGEDSGFVVVGHRLRHANSVPTQAAHLHLRDGCDRCTRAPDRDERACDARADRRRRRAPRGGRLRRARDAGPRGHGDRRDRRARAARDAAARGLRRGRAGAADPEAVQARLPRALARPDGDRGAGAPHRRRLLRVHRRAVHGRDPGADARDRALPSRRRA